jgi:hypothetical protein
MKKYIQTILLFLFVLFTNETIAQYCTPSTNSNQYMGIRNVQINTINNYTGGNNRYTNTNISTDLIPGNTYSITIQGYSYRQYASVWIDYNCNNVFDTNERVVSQLYLNYTGTANFTIPTSGITASVTRMRIKTDYYYSGNNNNNSYLYPCTNPRYGETEDYTVRFSVPFVITKNITVQLDVNGNASITPQDVDNGSYDSDGPVTLSIDKTTFNCDDLGGNSTEVSPTFAGQVSQNSHSVGAAYDPFKGEFLYPQWRNYTVYRYDENRVSLGSYTYPHRNIFDLWVDGETGDYFSTDLYNRRIYRVGSTNNVVWSVSVPAGVRGITSDAQYVYTHSSGNNYLRVYNKTNGAFVMTLAIPFSGYFRSLIYANGKIYIGGNALGGTTLPNNWKAIHIINAADGSYVSSFATSIQTSRGLAFDGEVIWAHNGGTAAGYKVAEGNAYGNGGSGSNTVILTVIDPLGYSNCGTAIVTVVDDIVPVIACPGTITVNATNACSADVTYNATATDNCSAEISYSIPSGSTFELGTTSVTATAKDPGGNEVSCTFDVIVVDSEAPVITCPTAVSINNTPGECYGEVVLTPPTVTDNCGSNGNGNALDFDGVNDYVLISNPVSSVFTLEAWIKTSAISSSGTLAWLGDAIFGSDAPGYVNDFNFTILNNQLAFYDGDINISTYGTTILNDNVWHHIAVIRNGAVGTTTLYVDGLFNGTSTCNNVPLDAHPVIGIGNSFTGRYFDGQIDDARIWNTARTQAEIQANMNLEIDIQPGLVASYHFNEGIANGNNAGVTTTVDASGNGNSGTLNNFALKGSTSNWVDGNVQLEPTITITKDAPATFAIGDTTVTWTATDGSGNTASCTQTVTVTDNEAPGSGAQFPAPTLALSNIPEAANYNLIYELNIPDNADWDDNSQVSYAVNNAAALNNVP